MAIIKCKMCGGDLRIEEGSTVCECEYCGTRQTVPSADNEKKLTLFSRAGRLLRGCEFDKAAGVFETIVADFPEEAEAYWGLVLCKYGIEYVDDPATGKKIPTCHRSSFDSVLDDPNYEQACENTDAIARRVYRDEARQIEDLRKQIIEVSGKEEPYDIFISYKETDENGDRTLDSVIAQDIYTELTEKGYRVFFSRISLEDKLGTEYEPYIFAALNSAKVMLVVGTDYENYDAVWVKNEWSRFLKLIASGQKKTLIPVFKNMDAYDMPKEFAKLAAQDMGKVGAMQDLVRGVEKLIGIKKTETASQQPVYVSNEADAKTAAAVKRGFMALEDSEWSKAKEYFDQALTLDAECAEAYLGLALADEQCANEDTYISRRCAIHPEQETKSLSPNQEREDTAVKNYALPHFLGENAIRELFKFDLSYSSSVKGTQKIAEQEKNSFHNNRNLTRAIRFSKGETKKKLDAFQSGLFTRLDDEIEKAKKQEAAAREQKAKEYEMHLEAAEQKAAELRREAEEKREAAYQSACKWQLEAKTVSDYQNIIDSFMEFQSYRDSSQHIEQCRAEIEALCEKARLQAKADAEEAERRRIAAAEEAERQRIEKERIERERTARKKRRTISAAFAVVLAVAAYFSYTKILVPAMNYKAAEKLYVTEQYEDAIAAFTALGDYKDSAAKIVEVGEAILARDYVNAEVLYAAEEYEKAVAAYIALGDYNDSIAKVKEIESILLANAKVGSKVIFGSYEQDNNTANGNEEIEWQVLERENNKILLISSFALDCQPYNELKADATWGTSSLRQWLNNSFFNSAFAKDRIEAVVKRCTVKDYLSEAEIRELFKFDLRYSSTYKNQQKIVEKEKAAFNANRSLTRAFQYAKDETANRLSAFKTALFTRLDASAEKAKEAEETARKEKQNAYVSFLSEAENIAEEKHREAEDRKEENYQNALESFKQAKTITDYQSVKDSFLALMPYKDSGEMIKRCDVEVSKIEKACVEQGLREHAVRKRRFVLTCMFAVIFAVVAFFTYTKFVVPANNYKVAKALFVAGQYEQAYTALSKLKGYRDVDYLLQNDENLVAVAARIAPFKTVGSTVSFGTYEQDNNTSNGEEAIEWIVLAAEEDKSLLISKYALDCREYDTNWNDSKWETCSLRSWLNGWFITSAFSHEEEAMIIPATVTADENTYFDTGISYSTTDRAFLLNSTEVDKYFNTVEARKCAPTKFAIAQGAETSETNKVNDEATCNWWLRSRFSRTGDSTSVSYAAYVGDDGAYMALGVGGTFVAVRPALWIQIG